MAEQGKQLIAEGASVTRPPAFLGEDYPYWRDRMEMFIKSTQYNLWRIITKGDYIPTNAEGQAIDEDEWSAVQLQKVQDNSKAKYLLTCALCRSEYDKVFGCKTAKDIWDNLSLIHEGTDQVKKNKISFYRQQYENFKMKDSETVEEMIGRFQTIMNSLKALGKEYDEEEKVRKIIKSLPAEWKAKKIAIEEAKDLDRLKVDELLGSLRLYELELEEENPRRRGKTIALKSKFSEPSSSSKAFRVSEKSEESDTSDDSSNDEETSIDDEISLISRNLKKLWRKRGDRFNKNKNKSRNFIKEKKNKNEIICFECKKLGHIKTECPNLKKEKKKFFKKGKRKGLLSTWDDTDSSSSEDDEEENEAAHIALMARTDSDSDEESEVNNELSELEESYENLLKDSKILLTRYTDLKKKNEELNLQLLEKDEIIQKLSAENSDLSEMNRRMSSSLKDLKESDSSQSSDEVQTLQQKVKELTSDLAKFVKGTDNLNRLMGTSRHPSDKSGLGFQKSEKPFTKTKLYSQCTICGKSGHYANRCFHRKQKVKPSGTNLKGPKKIWVPKTLIIPLADVLNRRKETPKMVPGQWMLTSHDGRKVYVPRPPAT